MKYSVGNTPKFAKSYKKMEKINTIGSTERSHTSAKFAKYVNSLKRSTYYPTGSISSSK